MQLNVNIPTFGEICDEADVNPSQVGIIGCANMSEVTSSHSLSKTDQCTQQVQSNKELALLIDSHSLERFEEKSGYELPLRTADTAGRPGHLECGCVSNARLNWKYRI